MKDRPTSLTIISWFLIITSLMSVVSTALSYNNPQVAKIMELSSIPIFAQYIFMVLGMAITLSCGFLLLKAKNVGRVLYVGWGIASLAIGLITSPAKAMLIPGLVIFVIITIFLYRPKANEYFSSSQRELMSDS